MYPGFPDYSNDPTRNDPGWIATHPAVGLVLVVTLVVVVAVLYIGFWLCPVLADRRFARQYERETGQRPRRGPARSPRPAEAQRVPVDPADR